MLKFEKIETDLGGKGDNDSITLQAAEVPGGVLCYLLSRPPYRVEKRTTPDIRSLTFVPMVRIEANKLVPIYDLQKKNPDQVAPVAQASGQLSVD